MSELNQPTQPTSADDEEDAQLKSRLGKSPMQRFRWILIAGVIAVATGSPLARLQQSYRGVILTVTGEQMLVAKLDRPPQWVPRISAGPGDIVDKQSFVWNPTIVTPEPRDAKLQELAKRYLQTYEGTIVELRPPMQAGSAGFALVALDGSGVRTFVPLGDSMAGAAVGRRVRKEAGQWDPFVMPAGDRPAAGFQPPPNLPN